MDGDQSKKKPRLDSSTTSTAESNLKPTHKQIVCALAPLVCVEVQENAKGERKEYVVRECPNKEYCKNARGHIRYQNKAGYKNPHLHLRTCLAKASFINSTRIC